MPLVDERGTAAFICAPLSRFLAITGFVAVFVVVEAKVVVRAVAL